ncbi:MAG: carbon-nitrogen hydrolase family protein [Promethearchaeota archaeon]
MGRVAAIQVDVTAASPDGRAEFRSRVEQLIRRAAAEGADAVVLPEAMCSREVPPSNPDDAERVPGPTSEWACRLAKELGVLACVGLVERERDALYSAALLVSPSGIVLHKHRRVKMGPGLNGYSKGRSVAAVDTRVGPVGVAITRDALKKRYLRRLANVGAKVALVPGGWCGAPEGGERAEFAVHGTPRVAFPPSKAYHSPWKDVEGMLPAESPTGARASVIVPDLVDRLYRRLAHKAKKHGLYLVCANAVGVRRVAGRECVGWGYSAAINPRGELVGFLGHAHEGVLLVDLPDLGDLGLGEER